MRKHVIVEKSFNVGSVIPTFLGVLDEDLA
jgi:hypothetical protein